MKIKNVAMNGLLVALAFILSYIESLFPTPFAITGMKLGLANLVVLTALYVIGGREAFALSLLRILLVGFTFSNLASMIFGMAGGLLSWLTMVLAKKSKWFGVTGVSIIGGVSHNIGQIIVAIIVVDNFKWMYYLPPLLITGGVTGTVIGIMGSLIAEKIKNV